MTMIKKEHKMRKLFLICLVLLGACSMGADKDLKNMSADEIIEKSMKEIRAKPHFEIVKDKCIYEQKSSNKDFSETVAWCDCFAYEFLFDMPVECQSINSPKNCEITKTRLHIRSMIVCDSLAIKDPQTDREKAMRDMTIRILDQRKYK